MPTDGINVGHFADIDNFGDYFDFNFSEDENVASITGVNMGQSEIELDTEERALIEREMALRSINAIEAEAALMPQILTTRQQYLSNSINALLNTYPTNSAVQEKIKTKLQFIGSNPTKFQTDNLILEIKRFIKQNPAPIQPRNEPSITKTLVTTQDPSIEQQKKTKIQQLRRDVASLLRQYRTMKAQKASASDIQRIQNELTSKSNELNMITAGGVQGFRGVGQMKKLHKSQMVSKKRIGPMSEQDMEKMYNKMKEKHNQNLKKTGARGPSFPNFDQWRKGQQKRIEVMEKIRKIKDLSPGTLAVIHREIRQNPDFINYLEKMLKDPDPAKRIFIEIHKTMQNTVDPSKFRKDKGVKQWGWMRRRIKPIAANMPKLPPRTNEWADSITKAGQVQAKRIEGMSGMGSFNFGSLFGEVLKVAATELNKEGNQAAIMKAVGAKQTSQTKAIAPVIKQLDPNQMAQQEATYQQAQAAKLSEESAEVLQVEQERKAGLEKKKKMTTYAVVGGGAAAALVAGLVAILLLSGRKKS